jgi:3-hydroxy-9,10-secoandrosta-1,3,5(10)-triene-9,17-dione monooxygenase
MTATTDLPGLDPVAAARELAPAIAQRAEQAERDRRIPDDTVRDLDAAGLLHAFRPARWGGAECAPRAFFDAVVEIGQACASTAWFLSVLAVHDWQLALFPERAQEDVWADGATPLISSAYAPTGKVTAVDGGFLLSGEWPYSSGCDHGQWAFLGGIVPAAEGDDPNIPDRRTFLVPRADYRIVDNWHTLGLRGTGSKVVVIDEAFVPEHRTHRFLDAILLNSPGQERNDAPLYRLPFGSLFPFAISVPAVGAAAGAYAHYREDTRTRTTKIDGARAVESPFNQKRLADAHVLIGDALRAMRHDLDEMLALATAGEEISWEQRTMYRRDVSRLVTRSVDATRILYEAAGSRVVFDGHPIQRALRDVLTVRAHFLNNADNTSLIFARDQLGLPPTEFFI